MSPGRARHHAFHCGVFSMSQKKEVSPNKCAQQSRERRRLCRKTGGEGDRHPSRPLWVARQQACWEATLTGFLMGLGVTAAAEAAYKPQAPQLHN